MSLTAVFYLVLFFGLVYKSLKENPIYGLFAYIQTIYMFAPGSWWGGGLPDLRWSLLSSLVTLISIFLHTEKRKSLLKAQGVELLEGPWYQSFSTKLLIMFAIWTWIQKAWVIGPTIHSEFAVMVTKFVLLVYLINKSVLTKEDFGLVIFAHVVGCSFFGYLGLNSPGGRFENAPTPGMQGSNQLALHMTPFLIASAYLLFLDIGKKRFIVIPFMVLTLNAIFLTQSRGAMAALGCVAVVSLLFIPRRHFKMFFLLASVAAVGGASLIGPDFIERIKTTKNTDDTGEIDSSAASRFVIINAQIEMWKNQPYIGYGHKGTMLLSPQYIDERWMTTAGGGEARRASHNLTMSLLVDHGLIGFSFYYGAIFWLFWKVWRFRSQIVNGSDQVYLYATGCFLALLDMLIASQFSNSIRLEVGIWFIALTGLAVQWLEFEKKKSQPRTDKTVKRAVRARA